VSDLVPVDALRHAVECIETVGDAKDIRDRAEALRVYARQAGFGLEAQNAAAAIKLRAERRAGELIREAQPGPTRFGAADAPSLAELGITSHQSSRWQRIARIPGARFEEYLEGAQAGRELTQAGALGLLRAPSTSAGKWTPKGVERGSTRHFKTSQARFRSMVFALAAEELRDLAAAVLSRVFEVSEEEALTLLERIQASKEAQGWDATNAALNPKSVVMTDAGGGNWRAHLA
jgi:hypothetical protein